ncbi:ATP-binding cassette domain-containing protein [Lysobacter ciconiae]|uniref:ATP-binding cassette domain-containing protein n=1 Tax=Novilysobacter ciconiae TaxID=2781022 RepID=A0A7S6UFQ5_9GAMM|nr:ATP-binding cassette domain-containing protein [Lysobacter ciconiae]QOW19441.1 ATP-binding cassette domain-containing protein [Lysobacter ciconiae]
MTDAIALDAVDKYYGQRQILRDLTLRVPLGSVFAFLGNNGHGKSTTIRLITGLTRAQCGSIRVLGHDITRERRRILAQTGCLIEAPSSYPNLTGAEFLSIGVSLKKLARTEIHRVLELVDLRGDGRQRIQHYSLGMKQRLALAHALLGSPRLLVLDEPTNGLDPHGTQQMRRLLSGLPAMANCTIFFSSHNLDEVEKTASHLAVLHDGAVRIQTSVPDWQKSLAGVLALDLCDAGKGALALQSMGYATTTDESGHLLVADVDRQQAGVLHARLMASGLTLYQSTLRKPSLEQWFLQTSGHHGSAT